MADYLEHLVDAPLQKYKKALYKYLNTIKILTAKLPVWEEASTKTSIAMKIQNYMYFYTAMSELTYSYKLATLAEVNVLFGFVVN